MDRDWFDNRSLLVHRPEVQCHFKQKTPSIPLFPDHDLEIVILGPIISTIVVPCWSSAKLHILYNARGTMEDFEYVVPILCHARGRIKRAGWNPLAENDKVIRDSDVFLANVSEFSGDVHAGTVCVEIWHLCYDHFTYLRSEKGFSTFHPLSRRRFEEKNQREKCLLDHIFVWNALDNFV